VVEPVETTCIHNVPDTRLQRVTPQESLTRMAWAYILGCSDGSLYVGSTRQLDLRLHQHQIGEGSAYTRHRLPVRLVWAHEFEHIGAAFAFEKQVQNWSRAKRLALIEGRFEDLPALARGRTGRPDA
jgi:putative endonuclease